MLLDALAGERLQLGADALELRAQVLLLLGLRVGRGKLGREALVAHCDLAQPLVALGGGLGEQRRKFLDPGLRLLERAAQVGPLGAGRQ